VVKKDWPGGFLRGRETDPLATRSVEFTAVSTLWFSQLQFLQFFALFLAFRTHTLFKFCHSTAFFSPSCLLYFPCRFFLWFSKQLLRFLPLVHSLTSLLHDDGAITQRWPDRWADAKFD
jgi:hypothetical protein